MNTTLSSNNSRFVITAAANQDSFLRVTFSAQPRSRARVGGFRASWSSCPLNTYWSKHCINPDIPRDSVAGVSECRSESPFEAKSDQSRIHLGACFRLFRNPLPWYQAERACRSWGGHLVTPATPVEQQIISQMILPGAAALSNSSENAWIGLHDIRREADIASIENQSRIGVDRFAAIKGIRKSAFPWSFSNNTLHGTRLENNDAINDCVEVTRVRDSGLEGGGIWKFERCSLSRAYVCSRHSGQFEDFGFSATGYSEADRRGYAVFDMPLAWTDADASCRAWGGELAVITSSREQEIVKRYAIRTSVWIGLSDLYSNSGQFQFSRGQESWSRSLEAQIVREAPLGTMDQLYKNWRAHPKEPRLLLGGRHCVAVEFENATWVTASCQERKSFICSRSWNHPCLKCPQHSVTLQRGGLDIRDCKCNLGHFGPDGSTCWQCPGGTYKDFAGSAPCVSCSMGKYEAQTSGLRQDCGSECPAGSTSLAHPGSPYISTTSPGPFRCTCAPGYAPDSSNIHTKNNYGSFCKSCQQHQYWMEVTAIVEFQGNCNCSESSGCSPARAGSGRSFGNISLSHREYRDGADCKWRIRSKDASTISLWFTRIDIETGYDSVTVRPCQSTTNNTCVAETDLSVFANGAADDTISMKDLYHNAGSHWAHYHTYVATAGIFEIEFRSDSTTCYSGFDIFWTVTPKCTDCPGRGSIAAQGIKARRL